MAEINIRIILLEEGLDTGPMILPTDQRDGTSGNDEISLDELADIEIRGRSGDDRLHADGVDVRIKGGSGNDIITAEGESLELYGGSGNDLIVANGNVVEIEGGSGDDAIEVLEATGFATIHGGSGNDTLNLESGDGALHGGSGNDVLVHGAGEETLTGGSGADTFVFNLDLGPIGSDTITDFEVGVDTILVVGGEDALARFQETSTFVEEAEGLILDLGADANGGQIGRANLTAVEELPLTEFLFLSL